jgi:phage shock protein A
MRALYKGPRIEDAFAKFEIIERRADLAEGRADAYALGGPVASLEDQFADLRAGDDVAAELAAMKARLARAAE